MSDADRLSSLERAVTLHRRMGDALAARGREEEARTAYRAALQEVDQALEALGVPAGAEEAEISTFSRADAADAAEWLGIQGGLRRRLAALDDSGPTADALESYRRGAAFEAVHDLPQTYNRANAIKRALVVGDRTVAQVRPDLAALRDALERRLAVDERAADDAWLWADLGDACLLLGEDVPAQSAYETFAAKARTDSPISTLGVLREITAALEVHGDGDAGQVARALESVEASLRRT